MVQYYTMEEAARILGTTADELKQLAKRGELRPFQDRGTLRFRTQEIDELARRRGRGSDPELQLGEAQKPKAGDSPTPKKKKTSGVLPPKKPSKVDIAKQTADEAPAVFDFTLSTDAGDQVEIGQELRPTGSGSGGRKSSGKLAPTSPPPKPGSDSDVRLVADGSDLGFQIASDSDVKMVEDTGATKSPSPTRNKKPSKLPAGQDSGVRLVPMDNASDSDVKIVPDAGDKGAAASDLGMRSPSDSDIRLDLDVSGKGSSKSGKKDLMQTDEIDLDAELRQAEAAARAKAAPAKAKPKPPSEPQLPTTSPFELSDDLDAGASKESSPESSSDFELTPVGEHSPTDSSSDIGLQADDEVGLGELTGDAGASGINLQDPADSGISLEQGVASSDEIEFELSLDEGSTPKPAKKDASGEVDSDSEFELTLDDSGGLAPLEEEGGSTEEEKDIFETDFEVPALDEESGSQAVALDESDTDLESSDFDLALGDEDIGADEESGSQVVALEDEEEADDAAATVARTGRGGAAVLEEEEVDELLGGEEEETVTGRRAAAPAVAAPPAQWGPLPALALLPCVIILFLVGFMGLELVRGMWGYHQAQKVTGTIIDPMARMFTDDLPPADK